MTYPQQIGDSNPLNSNFLMRLLAENLLVIQLACKAQRYVTGNRQNPSDEIVPIVSLILSTTYVKCGCVSIVDLRNPEHEGCFPKSGERPFAPSAQNRSLQ